MAVPDVRQGGGDGDADLFEEEVMDFEIPFHVRPLVLAAESGDLNSLRLALDNFDGNIDQPVEDGDTVLHLTCLYGHLTSVQLLLERGVNLEAKDEDGGIPLHDACAGGFTEIARLLLSSASEPECVQRMLETIDTDGDTPLHHAARGQSSEVIRLLLAYGASPKRTNVERKTPSELAAPGTEARVILEEATGAVLSPLVRP